jgi:tetratricopeptide (TPR) repeat protein
MKSKALRLIPAIALFPTVIPVLAVLALLPLCAIAIPQGSDPANPPQLDKKQLQAKAKVLVAEGKALEKRGTLNEARDKFVDAEGYLSTKDALNGIGRIRDSNEKQVEALLAGAHQSYDAGKFSDCAEKLEKGLVISSVNPALHYNLALCYEKLNDRAHAVEHLDSAITATRDKNLRTNMIQLRGNLLLGVAPLAAGGDAKKKIDTFNAAYLQEDRDAVAGAAGGEKKGAVSASVCDQIKELQPALPQSPAIVYDAAKCAEGDDRAGDAARLLGEYLRLAPQALDAADAQARQENLASLASLDGDRGAQVRSNFAAAALDLDYRRYDRAMTEYRAAEQIWPDYPLTQWRLALLYEGSGDIAQARKCFELYQQLETNPDRKLAASSHLASLEQWRSDYDDNTDEAHDLLGDLLLRSMGLSSEGVKRRVKLTKAQKKTSRRYQKAAAASETLSAPYVRRQLDRAQEDLSEAAQLFPIGVEANEMLALTDLEDNDWPSAYNSYDAVASAALPVSFYAQVSSSKDSKVVRAAKVEISKDTVRLVYLSSYNVKKKISEPPDEPAGDDDLGNLVTSAALSPDAKVEELSIPSADIQGVQTEKGFITVKRQKDQLMIVPVFMVAYTPLEGRAAREFGNEYTRMFVRYLGYENARLGKEGMTFGEKFKLGFSFVDLGMSVFVAVGTGGVGSYQAIDALRNLAHTLNVDTKTLQKTLSDQRRTLEGLTFKAIPTQPVQLAYRDHL